MDLKRKVKYLVRRILSMPFYSRVTAGKNVVFYGGVKIYNLQNNKQKIRIGEKTQVYGELHLFSYGGEIVIGDRCFIGENTKIWSGNKIIIGNDVLISHNVNIVDTNSH